MITEETDSKKGMEIMSEKQMLDNIKIEAYKYAEENGVTDKEKKEEFYSVLREAIDHVSNKKAVV